MTYIEAGFSLKLGFKKIVLTKKFQALQLDAAFLLCCLVVFPLPDCLYVKKNWQNQIILTLDMS